MYPLAMEIAVSKCKVIHKTTRSTLTICFLQYMSCFDTGKIVLLVFVVVALQVILHEAVPVLLMQDQPN